MSAWPRQAIREVADGIFTVVHGHGEIGVSNATFVVERDRAFVVDTMTFPEMSEGMVHHIQRRGAQVDIVLNTHHHIDHMGGNQVFADAHIMAHPASIQAVQRLGLPAPVYDRLMPQFQGRFAGLSLVIPEPLLASSVPFKGAQLLAFTPAHTPADVAVWFPEERVLLTGDLGFIGVVPLAVNGLISGWIAALDALIALDPAIVVPGHGAVGTLADLIVLREYFMAIEDLGRSAVAEQRSLRDVLAEFDTGPLAAWIEAERHAINLERVMQEARGDISASDLSAMPLSARKQ